MVILFARGGQASPEEQLACLVLILVVSVITIAIGACSKTNVVLKNGVPYCPACGRQVRARRGYCRSCGHKFTTLQWSSRKTPVPPTHEDPQKAIEKLDQAVERAHRVLEESRRDREVRYEAVRLLQEHQREKAEREKAERRAQRDEAYRAIGIEPGPFAWYKALPDWTQALLMGLAIALPAVIVLFVAFR